VVVLGGLGAVPVDGGVVAVVGGGVVAVVCGGVVGVGVELVVACVDVVAWVAVVLVLDVDVDVTGALGGLWWHWRAALARKTFAPWRRFLANVAFV
jgi:hypothetical protein